MTRDVALIVGGSVGAEVVPPVLDVLERAGAGITWHRVDVVASASTNPEAWLEEAVATASRCGFALKTRLIAPPTDASRRRYDDAGALPMNPNVVFRRRLGLFAGVRPIKTRRGLSTRYPGLDLLLVRENTEDIYRGIEHEIVPGVVQSLKVVTRDACDRIARYAFAIARQYGRKKITFVHKGNIMKLSDGLFLRTVRAVAERHPDIQYQEMIVDAACMQMVLDPFQFDLLLSGNLYGDLLSSLGTGLAGGISVGYSVGVAEGGLRVFEAIHGDAAHLVGTGRGNPLPLLSPAIELLRHLEQPECAERLDHAISLVLEEGAATTPDLGGTAGTRQMCDAIAERL